MGLIEPNSQLGQVAGLRILRIGGKKKPNNEADESGIRPVPNNNQQEPEEDTRLSESTRTMLSRLGIVGSGLIFLAGKTKFVLVALKMTKMTSIFSLLASTAAYGMVYGLPFGLGIVGMLLVHESGHAAMMLRLGIPITPMLFVPFMGAVVGMQQHPRSAYEHSLVAMAGPLVGSAAGLGVAGLGVALDSQFLMAVGDFGLWINLFNLLPIGGLDGGIVAGSLSRWFLLGGLGAGGAMIYTGAIANPMFYLIMFAAGFSTFTRFFSTHEGGPHAGYYDIPRNKKIVIGGSYLALIAALLSAMSWNNRYRKSPAQIRAENARAAGESLEHHPSKEPTMEDKILGWSTEYQDPEYFRNGSKTNSTEHQLHQEDPYFQQKGGQWR
jgi:Zn-dependent protease